MNFSFTIENEFVLMTVHTTFDLSKNHAFNIIWESQKHHLYRKKIRFVTRILIEAKYYGDLSIIYFSKIEIHAYIIT